MQAMLGAIVGITIGVNLMTLAINHNFITDVKPAQVLVAHGCGSYDKNGNFKLKEME